MDEKDKKLEKLLSGQKDLPFVSIADEVMSSIEDAPVIKGNGILVDMTRLFPKVAAACLMVIFALLLRTYIIDGSLDSESILGLTEMTADEAYTFYD